MNKPEDYGVNILITPELIEAIEIVQGTTEPHAVGRKLTDKHGRALAGAFKDAMGQLEANVQMLDQVIEAGESCLPSNLTDERPDISWLAVPKDILEDSRLTIKYVNEKLGF